METLQNFIENINRNLFLAEFTYLKNTFRDVKGYQQELADCIVLYNDIIVLFQLKERDINSIKSYESEEKWFQNKLLNKAKKQIKNSQKLFEVNDNIEISNLRDHKANIKNIDHKKTVSIILFKHDSMFPLTLKKYISQEVGFIHIIDSYDYSLICDVLATPPEVIEYLTFREELLTKFDIGSSTEKSILGAFLRELNLDSLKESKTYDLIILNFEDDVDKLLNKRAEFDINYILEDFERKIYTDRKDVTSYYKLLIEFSKMNRLERKAFKERWEICARHIMEKDEFILPYRIIISSSKCGIIFIPVLRKDFENRYNILKNATILSKYETKLDKHIGIIFCSQNSFAYIDYIYFDSPWKYNSEIENRLKETNPFRPLKEKKIERYQFMGNEKE